MSAPPGQTDRPPADSAPPVGRFARLLRWIDLHPVQFLLIFTAVCAVAYTVYLLGYFEIVDNEEGRGGNIPKDLVEGMLMPLADYVVVHRENGTYPVGIWCYPFVALFGPSIFALKLGGVTLLALGAWPWVDLARRMGGALAALAVGLLIVLPFPFYLRMALSLSLVVTHLGGTIWTGLALWLLYRGFVDDTLRRVPAAIFAGLAFGAGIFWTFSVAAIAVGLVVTALLWRVRLRFIALVGASAAPGVLAVLLIGLLPLVRQTPGGLWGSIRDWTWPRLLGPKNRRPQELTVGRAAREAVRVVTDHLPRLGGFVPPGKPPHVIGFFPSVLYYILVLAAGGLVLLCWWRGRSTRGPPGEENRAWRRVVPLWAPIPIYLAIYLASGLYADEEGMDRLRYFLPLVPFGMLTIGVAVSLLARMGRHGGRLAAGALALLLGMGVVSANNALDFTIAPTPYRIVRGFDVFYYLRYPHYINTGLRHPNRSDHRDLAYMMGMRAAMGDDDPPLPLRAEVPGLAPMLWADYWEGVGSAFRERDEARALNIKVFRAIASHGIDRYAYAWIKGFAKGGALFFNTPPRLDMGAFLTEALGPWPDTFDRAVLAAWEGMGEAAHMEVLYLGDPHSDLPRPVRDAYYRGIATALARWCLPERPWPAWAPLPEPFDEFEVRMPRRFRAWMEQERGRLLAIRRAFVRRPPLRRASR